LKGLFSYLGLYFLWVIYNVFTVNYFLGIKGLIYLIDFFLEMIYQIDINRSYPQKILKKLDMTH